LVNGKFGQNETVGIVGLQIDKFNAGRGGFGGVLKSVEAGLKVVSGINVRRPLIAAGVKETGCLVAQQNLHKNQKGLLPSGWAAAPPSRNPSLNPLDKSRTHQAIRKDWRNLSKNFL
jgi:hypothetical protein